MGIVKEITRTTCRQPVTVQTGEQIDGECYKNSYKYFKLPVPLSNSSNSTFSSNEDSKYLEKFTVVVKQIKGIFT